MNKQNALKHLLFEHRPSPRPSTKYGTNNLGRSLVAWTVALKLNNGNEKKVSAKLLDDIIGAVERGDNVIDAFYDREVDAV
jgi:hypothetical protein